MVKWEPQPRVPDALERVAAEIMQYDNWMIVTHERPDGDAIGSALAVAHILDALGKKWTFVVGEPVPVRFAYLALLDRAQITDSSLGQFEHVIAVDSADEARFAPVAQNIHPDAVIVNIDHHRTNPRYGRVAMVDDEAAATCELIYHLARQLNVEISTEMAKCLYTGILTDTCGFAQPNTTREVHQVTAELLASGVKPYDISEPALESRTWEQMRLFQIALNNLTVSSDGKYAAIYVTRGMLEGAGATDDDCEGLVTFTRSIDTVEVGMMFRETADGKVKASLRSKRIIDVSEIAQHFGGGGHARAAGCVLDCSLDEAMDRVVEEVEVALSEAGL